MAISTTVTDSSLTIEVANGVDAAGDTKWAKKTFNGLKSNAENQNVYDTAQAIKSVLNGDTNRILVNVTSSIANA